MSGVLKKNFKEDDDSFKNGIKEDLYFEDTK